MVHDFAEDKKFFPDMTLGEYIKKKRRLAGLNQTDMAELFGIDQGTLSRWEREETSPPFDVASYIVRKLGGEVWIVNINEGRINGYGNSNTR